jgi:glycosyltransferase involved in cell wall biosynthesis
LVEATILKKVASAGRRLGNAIVHRTRPWRNAGVDHLKDLFALVRVGVRRFALVEGQAASCSGRKRILIIDELVPDPLFGAGYPRAFEIVRSLVKAGHQVSVYPMTSKPAEIARMTSMLAGAVSFYPGEGWRGLRRLLWTEGTTFDTLFISRPDPMRCFVDTTWRPSRRSVAPPVIYDSEAVLSQREARRRALFGPAWSDDEYNAALDAELGLARSASAVTAVSRRDGLVIQSVLKTPVFVLPHSVDARAGTIPFEERKDFLFVGRLTGSSFYSPNVDSVVWFVTQVMPILDELMGSSYKFHIAGLIDAPELAGLLSDRVVLHGVVENLDPLYGRCRVFVAPTRFAAGIPLKVVEALGRGVPCVVTPLLAEQLSLESDALPTGASPRQFAEQCMILHTDPEAWHRARDSGIAHVRRSYSPDAFDRVVTEAFGYVDGLRRPRTGP